MFIMAKLQSGKKIDSNRSKIEKEIASKGKPPITGGFIINK